eukprot:1743502-Pleurochrysis_carterae.AAC.6
MGQAVALQSTSHSPTAVNALKQHDELNGARHRPYAVTGSTHLCGRLSGDGEDPRLVDTQEVGDFEQDRKCNC